MTTITITGNTLEAMRNSMGVVEQSVYASAMDALADAQDEKYKLELKLKDTITDRDVLMIQVDKAEHQARRLADSESAMVQREMVRESELQDLQQRYDACAEVRDRTAVQMKEALDRIAELELAVAEHDDSTDQQNKTKFNVDDVQRAKAEGYSAAFGSSEYREKVDIAAKAAYAQGYDKGRSEQMAEHAAELVNRTPPLQAMLGYDKVQLHLRNNAPFIFAPERVERQSRFVRKYGAKMVGEDTVGITGISELSKHPIFIPHADVTSWSALAPEPTKG